MTLYDQLKKFDTLANPPYNKKIYYVTEMKQQIIHPLIPSYNFEEAWEQIKDNDKIIRLKKDECELEFIDVDTDDEHELNDFLEKIKNYSYIKIKSQTANHYHIFLKI